eukprot:TRINITY_DN1104_c0_g1_i2.p1 TRINITY_DN1104_c0_g1~~TRINITY_DN1104_c0_g1_i2.p1  ORF type:complete len:403 (+),score=17.48 TRINITY_DN1104_c0_g1_i2:42-1250(+)
MLPNLTADLIGRRDIALLGEGDFEYAVRMAKAHPHLRNRMFASDINVNLYLGKEPSSRTADLRMNIATLEGLGVLVGVLDAGRMPAEVRCSWVQFNGPRGYKGAHIPKVMNSLVKWCASHLTKGGTLHISCHGDQGDALSGMGLARATLLHGLEMVNANNTLQSRSGYTARRTNGTSFWSCAEKNLWEYVFVRKGDTTYGTHCVDFERKRAYGLKAPKAGRPFYHAVTAVRSNPIELGSLPDPVELGRGSLPDTIELDSLPDPVELDSPPDPVELGRGSLPDPVELDSLPDPIELDSPPDPVELGRGRLPDPIPDHGRCAAGHSLPPHVYRVWYAWGAGCAMRAQAAAHGWGAQLAAGRGWPPRVPISWPIVTPLPFSPALLSLLETTPVGRFGAPSPLLCV